MPTRVKLTRKFAQIINGIDLSKVRAGEEIDLSARDAELLIAEGWATPTRADDRARRADRRQSPGPKSDPKDRKKS